MRLSIQTDLEGVAGVVSFEEQTTPEGRYYEMAKRLLSVEVNAAIEGALAAGATDVVVNDGHGHGGIDYETIHEAAAVRQGRPRKAPWADADFYGAYDFTCIIGQHSMEGTADGNLNHTQSSKTVDHYKLNGKYIGEIAQWALCAGACGVPLIFLSGDTAACREAQALIPGITTAGVKEGITRGCAISLSHKRARDLIRDGMKAAIQKQKTDPVAPLRWPEPYRLEIRYKHTDNADAREAAGWERVDAKTVALESDDILKIIYA